MKILQIAADVRPDRGGPSRSVSGLCKALSSIGHEVVLYIHDPWGAEKMDIGGCQLCHGRPISEVIEGFHPDIAHLHGVWIPALHWDAVSLRKKGIPYLIAPRGSLDAWSVRQKWLKKKLALLVYQGRDIRKAVALHVTAKMEEDHCRRLGFAGPFVTSPNGVNFPLSLPKEGKGVGGKRRMLFLSRIHPKKGLLELVRAWALVRHDGWVLEIVGNDSEGYWAEVEKEIARLGVGASIVRTPFQNDGQKWQTYRNADCFVLPTHTENFGIVIAEALYAGIPVITTKGAPWSCLRGQGCGWWIDLDEKSLVGALSEAMSISAEQRAVMGSKGRDFVLEEFNWSKIAEKLVGDYRILLKNGKLVRN